MFLNQIQYLGLLENVKVRRAGYAFRMLYERFLSKYKCISRRNLEWNTDSREGTSQLLKEESLEKDVEYGKTKIFIRTPKSVFALEEQRTKFIQAVAAQIEKSHHDDIIWADKVWGFDKNCKRAGLQVAFAAQGVHVFDGKKLLHRAPLEDFSGITLPESDGWMVLHMMLGPDNKPKTEFLYLIDNVYKLEVEAVLSVLKASGSNNLQLGYSSTIPLSASDPKAAKQQQKAAQSFGKACTIL